MAVLIPDMDYPKRCGDCDFCIMFTDNMTDKSFFRCVHLYEDVNTEKKRGDCPLVEVQAHGDLIDRDLWLATHWASEQVIEAIKDAPTVLEASK